MKTSRIVLSFVASMAFSFVLAGEASANGACVYVKGETFQCSDHVASANACKQKAPGGLGEYHAATSCKRIGHGVTWGLVSPTAPPAKASFEGASYSGKAPAEVPSIPSPFQKSAKTKMRF
jgi:hypothetical protein